MTPLPKLLVAGLLLLTFRISWGKDISATAILVRSFEPNAAGNILARSTKTRSKISKILPTPVVATGLNHTILQRVDRFQHLVDGYSEIHELDPDLVRAVIYVESGGNHRAVSPKGASGLMQLMPHSFVDLDTEARFDPEQNISSGTQYLRAMINRFKSVELALWAYNAGPTSVDRDIMPLETQKYVPRVLRIRRVLESGKGQNSHGS